MTPLRLPMTEDTQARHFYPHAICLPLASVAVRPLLRPVTGLAETREAVDLRLGEIDSHRQVVRVHPGKDRYVMLSSRLLAILSDYWLGGRTEGSPAVTQDGEQRYA